MKSKPLANIKSNGQEAISTEDKIKVDVVSNNLKELETENSKIEEDITPIVLETSDVVEPAEEIKQQEETKSETTEKVLDAKTKEKYQRLSLFDENAFRKEQESLPVDEVSVEELDAEASIRTMSLLLKSSEETIEAIEKQIRADSTKETKPLVNSNETVYTNNGASYILTQEQCEKIYTLIMESKLSDMRDKTLISNPKSLRKAFDLAGETKPTFKNPILHSLDKEELFELIKSCLSFTFVNSLREQQENVLKVSTVINSFSETIVSTFMTKYFIYYDFADGSQGYIKPNTSKRKPVEFGSYNFEQTLKIILYIAGLNTSGNIESKDPFIVEFAKKLPEFVTNTEENKGSETENDPLYGKTYNRLLRQVICYYLYQRIEKEFSAEKRQILKEEKVEKPTKSYENVDTLAKDVETQAKDVITYGSNIGAELIDWLIAIGILVDEGENNRNVPEISLKEDFHGEVILSASYVKPGIHPENLKKIYSSEIKKNNISLVMQTDLNPVRHSEGMTLEATPKLREILDTYDKTPYVINKQVFQDIKDMIRYMLDSTDYKDPNLVTILSILYKIPLENTLAQQHPNNLVYDLLLFGKNLNQYHDLQLFLKCKGNLACTEIYNKMCSYKYFLLDMFT